MSTQHIDTRSPDMSRHKQQDIEAFLNVTLDLAARRIIDSGHCKPFSVATDLNGCSAVAELAGDLANTEPLYETLRNHCDELSACAVVTESRCANGSPALTMTYENNQHHAFRVVQSFSLDVDRGTYSFDEPLVAHSVASIWGE